MLPNYFPIPSQDTRILNFPDLLMEKHKRRKRGMKMMKAKRMKMRRRRKKKKIQKSRFRK